MTRNLISRTILFSFAALLALLLPSARGARAADLSVGDPAPVMAVKDFVKGKSFTDLAAGKTTVVEFWATWCGPCKVSIPHLTELAAKYPAIRFVGVSVWEQDQGKVAPFVKEMGDKMNYTVARDIVPAGADGMGGVMAKTWMAAAGQDGIPTAFIVGGDGRIQWIGYPWVMDEPLAKIAAGKWEPVAAKISYLRMMTIRRRQTDMASALASVKIPGDPKSSIGALDALVARTPDDEIQTSPTKFKFLREQGEEAGALTYGERILSMPGKDPYWPLNEIAWQIVNPESKIKPTAPMLAFALRAAKRATELADYEHANIDDTLAATQFANGDVAGAIKTEERAVSLAKDAKGAAYSDRLAVYRSRLVETNK